MLFLDKNLQEIFQLNAFSLPQSINGKIYRLIYVINVLYYQEIISLDNLLDVVYIDLDL